MARVRAVVVMAVAVVVAVGVAVMAVAVMVVAVVVAVAVGVRDLVDEEQLGHALRLAEDRLPVGRGLHVAREHGAPDLVLPWHLHTEGRRLG